jgi:hypothetical protein
MRSSWKAEYNEASSESLEWYKSLRGNRAFSRKDPIDNIPRADLRLLTKFRLGRFPTQEYMYSIQQTDNPYCLCGEEETALHVLMECRLPHRTAARLALPPASHPSMLVFSNNEAILKATASYLRLAMKPPQPAANHDQQ